MSVNKVILIGRLGKDPETRYMPNGDAVTNATLATSESWKDKSGVKQEKSEWHNLTFYRKLAEIAGEYLKKGSMIYVEGKLQTRKWTDKEGKDRYTTDIIVNDMTMLGSKRDAGDNNSQEDRQQAAETRQQKPQTTRKPVDQSGGARSFDNFDDDIPFADPYGRAGWRIAE